MKLKLLKAQGVATGLQKNRASENDGSLQRVPIITIIVCCWESHNRGIPQLWETMKFPKRSVPYNRRPSARIPNAKNRNKLDNHCLEPKSRQHNGHKTTIEAVILHTFGDFIKACSPHPCHCMAMCLRETTH